MHGMNKIKCPSDFASNYFILSYKPIKSRNTDDNTVTVHGYSWKNGV